MVQVSLFDRPKEKTIQEQFDRFRRAHPEVYDGLRDICYRWLERGRGRWSIDAAFHVLRWERRLAGLPDPFETFKLNNNYTSRFARLLMAQEPELDGLFELRGLRTLRPGRGSQDLPKSR